MSLVTDVILEKLNSLIVVVNPSGDVDYVSPSVRRILGFEPEQLIGQGWWNLTRSSEDERADIRSLVQKQIEATRLLETVPYEKLLRTANGGTRWILWNTSKGPLNTLVGIGHDITERKHAEQQLLLKNKQLEEQNREMLDSIRYASQLQQSILVDPQKIRDSFADAFVLYQPKDVVSGDYYFQFRTQNKVFLAAVDCTGHGVPGALMSVVADSVFREVIQKRGLQDPAQILYALDEELYLALNKNRNETISDGMDVALAVIDLEQNTLEYAGAFRPALILRGEEFIELEASRYPIGFYADVEKSFSTTRLQLQKDDLLYLFTDGYCDQFGGEKKKKFNRRRFKELLLSAQSMTMEEQESFLSYAHRNWRQEEEQVDDVLVIGVRI
jgi:PAS domain S-box-containing protein